MGRKPNPIVPLTSDQQDVAAGLVPLARRLTSHFARRFPGLADEVESAAMLGVVGAAAVLTPGMPEQWAAGLAYRIALNGVLQMLAKERRRARVVVIFVQGEEWMAYHDDFIESHDTADLIESMFRRLSPATARTVRLCVMHGMSHASVSAMMGRSPTYVLKRVRSGLDHLRITCRGNQ